MPDRKHGPDQWKPLDLNQSRRKVFWVSMVCIAMVLLVDLFVDWMNYGYWTSHIILSTVEMVLLFIISLWSLRRGWSRTAAFLMVAITEINILLTSGISDVLVLLDLFFIVGLSMVQAFLVGNWAMIFTMVSGVGTLLLLYHPEEGDFMDNRAVVIMFLVGFSVILYVFTRTLLRMTKRSQEQWEALLENRDAVESRERLNLVNKIVSGLSHNINTPLGNVRMRLSVLREGVTGTHRDLVASADKDLEKIASVVRELRQFSIRDTEDTFQEVSPERLGLLVGDVLTGQDMDGLRSEVDFSGAPVVTRPLYLLQVVMILVENAHLYGRDEDGRLELSVRMDRDGSGYHVAVKDSGPGIPPEYGYDMFEPYFRMGTSGRGRGMGLSIARQVCTYRLGGSISYDAETNVFDIRLPGGKVPGESGTDIDRGPAPDYL